jgi:carbon monoxide dehydrogenase subunit G
VGKLGGEATVEVDAAIEDVWAVCEDVASAPEWQQGLEAMEVIERDADGRVELADSVSDAKVRTVRTRVRFSYEEPTRVSWRQEKGDLKSLDGEWELESLGEGRTRATYRLEGDPGRVLGMLIRGPVETTLRGMLVGGRPEELRARVEGA